MQLAERYIKKEDFQMKGIPKKSRKRDKNKNHNSDRGRRVYILVQERRPRARL